MSGSKMLRNWHTTLAGVIMIAGLILPATGLVTEKQASAITSVAGAFGLMKAKDDNVTGGTKENAVSEKTIR